MREPFRHVSRFAADYLGSPLAFVMAAGLIVVWAISGPLFHFSDTWQLVINTSTTIVTFLMVFLIQNTQNRDAMAVQLKLDELLRSVAAARTGLVDLESLDDEQLKRLKRDFEALSQEHSNDVGVPVPAATTNSDASNADS